MFKYFRILFFWLFSVSAQEELRCRQLELEVKGLSAKVDAADSVRRRLEESLLEARRERDVLKVGMRRRCRVCLSSLACRVN